MLLLLTLPLLLLKTLRSIMSMLIAIESFDMDQILLLRIPSILFLLLTLLEYFIFSLSHLPNEGWV
jgi:hypothetical protein